MDQLRTFRLPVVNLQQLRFVVAAADYGSIRQAAELLSIRHSTLSRTIRQLEDVIGVVVFERSGGGVEPTLAGRSVVRIARLILDQVDSLVDTGRSIGVGDTGRLSIGFSTSMSAGNLRATLLEFKTRFPNVDLMTVERSRVRLANALRCGTVDIVISPGSLSMADSTVLSL
ncbi:LysR family transcriptional regulator [Bradyrhizobium sp. SZCCHNS1054]|nr:LysR family transcriptional regulator [Bradyrhizobium sp. SZCCHNS1054]